MKEIIELVNLVKLKATKKIEFFSLDNQSNLDKLYYGVVEKKLKTDAEAASFIYNTLATDKKYLMLKSRLEDRLLEVIYYWNDKQFDSNPMDEAWERCSMLLITAKKLITLGNIKLALKILDETNEVAEKFELFTLINEVCNLIIEVRINHKQKFNSISLINKISKSVMFLNEISKADLIKVSFYESIRLTKNKTLLETEIEKIKKLEFSDVFKVKVFYFESYLIYHGKQNNYNEIVRICGEFIDYLLSKRHLISNEYLIELPLLEINAHLMLKNYSNGISLARNKISLFEEGTKDWYSFLKLYALCAIRSKDFVELEEIFNLIINEPEYKDSSQENKLFWNVLAAYYNLYYKFALTDSDYSNSQIFRRKFNVNKLLREKYVYSKIFHGYSLSSLILICLNAIADNKLQNLENLHPIIKKLIVRFNLKEDDNNSIVFLNLVSNIIGKQYNIPKIGNVNEKHLQKLKNNLNITELEVIPYLELWDLTLIALKKIDKIKIKR
ncbi:MAG: hypothetical protein NTW25_00850 [Candidatus Kapabacteria bacterium]|nr:hypothetical protein [Candidatus Kapabacteria bacterium]